MPAGATLLLLLSAFLYTPSLLSPFLYLHLQQPSTFAIHNPSRYQLLVPQKPSLLYSICNSMVDKIDTYFSLSFLMVSAQQPDPPFPPYPLQEGFTRDSPQRKQQQEEYNQQQQQQEESIDTTTQQAYSYGIAGEDDSLHESPDGSTPASTYHAKSLMVHIPSLGKLQGKREHGVDFYGNIPYAAPPVGQSRFAPPEPPPPWAPVILDGTHYGPDCWQLIDPVVNPGARHDYMSEDCLTLNVFTPAGHAKKVTQGGLLFDSKKQPKQDKLLPVLVWLHGGGFQQGGARRPEYDGRRLAERDVLVVTINYRLGALGFMVSSPDGVYGNYGLMDQRAALHFIHDNIVHFGGDPQRVTLFGESAGAVMTGLHLMMEGAGTLFQAAIMQSNPLGYTFRSVVVADFIGEMNQFSGEAAGKDSCKLGKLTLKCREHGLAKGQPAIISLRPEDIIPHETPAGRKLAAAGNSVPVTIGSMEFLGSFWRSTLTGGALGKAELTAQFSINAVRRLELQTGQDIIIELPAERLRAFPAKSGTGS